MSFHHAEDIKYSDKFFPVVQNHCKQVLKQLNDTQLDFVLLSCEDDDESFNLITCQRALATLAFEQGDTETLAKIPTVIRKCNDHRNASILMNDLGVMLSLKAVYQRSEDCFFIANNYFERTEDHLNSAIVTFNLAALYIIQGEYQKALHFSDLAANLCHDITMRTTNDANLPMKVLKRAADILKELGNLKKFRNILRISIKFDIGGKEACEVDASKWLIKVQLREEEGGKIEGKELDELNSHLFTLINALDAQSLTADFVRTVLTAARVNYRNGLDENAFRLLEMLEYALLMSSGRKDPLYGWLLFQIGQFKLGCGMISNAEKSLKQAELILMKCQGRNYHLLAHCKKLIGSCALLNNNLEGAFTNLNDAFTFFSDINSQHFELADISLKLSQLQIEKGNFQDAKEMLQSSLVKLTDSCGEISPKTASGYVQAGLILQKVDKEAAIDKVTQAIDILHRLGFPFHHPEVKLCQRLIGLLQLSLGKKQEAEISVSKETLEIDKKLHLNAKCLVNEGSTTEASALDCSSEVTLRRTSSSFPLQNQEFPPVRCVDVCLCLLDSMLRSRRADYKQKSLNCAPPFSLVFSSVDISSLQGNLSFLSSESVPSLSSFPESPGTDIQHPPVFRKELPPLSFPPGCDGPREQFLNEPHVCSNGDNIDAHLSKPGTREETEDEDHCTEVLHWITESNVPENPVNFDSTDGVIRQKDERVKADVPCIEVNKCSPVQMVANHCTSDQNLSQEIHSPVTQGIERRALWKRIFHPVIMKKEEESVLSQSCHSFKLQEKLKTLKDQLRESKAEIQQLKAELGRYLFLEDREKRSRKLQLVPRPPTSDESRQYAASVSCNETSLDRRLLVQGAYVKRQPGPSLRTVFIDISNSLSAVEFQHMKDLAKGKVNDFKLARMKVPYQLLDELERVSGHPRTDIRELLESIQRFDLLEKLGVSLDAGIAAVSPTSSPLKDESLNLLSADDERKKIVTRRSCMSARSSALSGEEDGGRISGNQEDNSFASFLSLESSAENEREIPASRDTEDNEGLPLESVRTNVKEDTHVSFSSDQAGPSSVLGSTSSNSSDSLVLNIADGVQVICSRGSSLGCCEETEPTEMFTATGSGFSDGITSGKTSLNTGSLEEGIPREAQFSDSEDIMTDVGENIDTVVDDVQGSCASQGDIPSLYIGAMGPYSYERLGGAYSDVPRGGSAARAGLLGGSLSNESSYSSSTHPTAAPWPSLSGQTHFSSVCDGMSSDIVHTSNRLLPPNDFSTSDHSLTGEQDSLLDQNFLGSRLSLQQINTLISLNSRFVYGSTSMDFAAGIHPGYSMYGAQRHVLSDGNSALIDDQRSRHGNLNLESQSSQFGGREEAEGSFAADGVVVGSRNFPLLFTDSSSTVPCNMVVSDSTSLSSIAVASNITSTVVNANKNSLLSPTLAGDGIEETSLLPVSGEVNLKGTSSNRDYGRNTVEPNDSSLAASEQRTAEDVSALVERRLREREEREEFMRELQRKEQMLREERERERREKEDREWQEAERWPQQQEGVSTGLRCLCEDYQPHSRAITRIQNGIRTCPVCRHPTPL